MEYSCLGDWFVDKNHYFAVANTKESRKDETYRCFLKNRDDDLYIGVSITAECNTLKTPEKSPERMRITPGMLCLVIKGLWHLLDDCKIKVKVLVSFCPAVCCHIASS